MPAVVRDDPVITLPWPARPKVSPLAWISAAWPFPMKIELVTSAIASRRLSGDGDFTALVAALQRKGKRVTVVSMLTTPTPMISDDLRRQADFFLGFTQRRLRAARVGGLDAAAWKTDLSGMRREVFRALGQQQIDLPAARDERYQHGGGAHHGTFGNLAYMLIQRIGRQRRQAQQRGYVRGGQWTSRMCSPCISCRMAGGQGR